MSDLAVFDSSVLVDHLRTNCHAGRIASLGCEVRYSAVVLAELWRGVRTEAERHVLAIFELSSPLLTPSGADWIDSGRILGAIRKRRGYEAIKLRDLHFDVLIALAARSASAKLITSNRADFEMIREFVDFRLEIW